MANGTELILGFDRYEPFYLHGFDDFIDLTDEDALAIAALSCSDVNFLKVLDLNPDLNYPDERVGRTPLHWCAFSGYDHGVKILIDRGVDINAQDVFGKTALHIASERSKLKVVLLLISHPNINPFLLDDQNRTPKECSGCSDSADSILSLELKLKLQSQLQGL
jgi:uncharacterized protein